MLQSSNLNIKEYYNTEYRKKFTDNIEKPSSDPATMLDLRKKYQSDRLDIMIKYFKKDNNFFEIGCSAGQFLIHVRNEFSFCEGLELDMNCAKFVEENFNIKVFTKELQDCGISPKRYDNIAAFQVLEHVPEPIDFLKNINKYLKDDGHAFIEVPNLYDPLLHLWQIEGYQKFYYHEAHVHYFSRKSLEKLFSLAGLKINEFHYTQDYNLFNHFYWFFNNVPQKECTFGLSAPSFKFNDQCSHVGNLVNELLANVDKEYKNILSNNEMTSNIFLVASKA